MDERDVLAVIEEFTDSEEELERQIEDEWERMYAAGQTIRVGDASRQLAAEWMAWWGVIVASILRRKGEQG